MSRYDPEQELFRPQAEPEKGFGPILGALLIMGILIAAGVFILSEKTHTAPVIATSTETIITIPETATSTSTSTPANPAMGSSTVLSTTNEVADIEADLNGTDLSGMDTVVNAW